MTSHAARTEMVRRWAEWAEANPRRLDKAGKALLAASLAMLAAGVGRPRVLTREEAEAAVAAHGGVEAAARALGCSPTTVRTSRKG